jgi:hypothetical protein
LTFNGDVLRSHSSSGQLKSCCQSIASGLESRKRATDTGDARGDAAGDTRDLSCGNGALST